MQQPRKVTIQDVARYANVSVGTIDRVIHNRGKVSPQKHKLVEEAISRLNFNPNLLARTLALGKNFTICALIPSAPSGEHYWSLPLQGIKLASCQYRDYGISTEYFFYNQFEEQSFIEQAASIEKIHPDGVIMAPMFLNEGSTFAARLSNKGIPYVFIDVDLPGEKSLSYIGPDLKSSAGIAARMLHSEIGEKAEILIVNMVKGIENDTNLRRMEVGFRGYFKKNGLYKKHPVHTLTVHSDDKEDIWHKLTRCYLKNPSIEAVFVTNSKAYLVAEFHKFHDLDIRLAGYDLLPGNIRYLKKGGIDYIISQSPVQQGQRAVQTLFDYFTWKKKPEKVQHVPLDIIIRENVDFYLSYNNSFQNGFEINFSS